MPETIDNFIWAPLSLLCVVLFFYFHPQRDLFHNAYLTLRNYHWYWIVPAILILGNSFFLLWKDPLSLQKALQHTDQSNASWLQMLRAASSENAALFFTPIYSQVLPVLLVASLIVFGWWAVPRIWQGSREMGNLSALLFTCLIALGAAAYLFESFELAFEVKQSISSSSQQNGFSFADFFQAYRELTSSSNANSTNTLNTPNSSNSPNTLAYFINYLSKFFQILSSILLLSLFYHFCASHFTKKKKSKNNNSPLSTFLNSFSSLARLTPVALLLAACLSIYPLLPLSPQFTLTLSLVGVELLLLFALLPYMLCFEGSSFWVAIQEAALQLVAHLGQILWFLLASTLIFIWLSWLQVEFSKHPSANLQIIAMISTGLLKAALSSWVLLSWFLLLQESDYLRIVGKTN